MVYFKCFIGVVCLYVLNSVSSIGTVSPNKKKVKIYRGCSKSPFMHLKAPGVLDFNLQYEVAKNKSIVYDPPLNMVTCFWEISVPRDHLVHIVFRTSPQWPLWKCQKFRHRLSVYYGRYIKNRSWPIANWRCRLYGQTFFISKDRYMSLRYNKHYTKNDPLEFKADFKAIHQNDTRCQPTVTNLWATNSTRNFTTPLFPSLSTPGQFCTWLITAPEGHVVHLQFSPIIIDRSKDCVTDYVVARDGANSTDPLLVKVCGRNHRCPVLSSGRYMWLQFKTDPSDWPNGNGFRAKYKAIQQIPETMLEGDGTFNISLTQQDIFKKVDADIKCMWNLTAPPNNFINFSIELASPKMKGCYLQERLDVIDGSQLGGLLLMTTRNHSLKARSVTSSGQRLLLKLLPNLKGTSCSFKMRFRIWRNTSARCPPTVTNLWATNSTRNFTSPLLPSLSTPGQFCTWLITAPEGHVVHVQFSTIAIGPSKDCVTDYVVARDGANSTDSLLVNQCDINHRCPVLSSGRYMWLQFKTNRSLCQIRNGFRAQYKAIQQTSLQLTTPTIASMTGMTFNIINFTTTPTQFVIAIAQRKETSAGIKAGIGLGSILLVSIVVSVIIFWKKKQAKYKRIRHDKWEVPSNKIEFIKDLGEGAFGKVVKGRVMEKDIRKKKTSAKTEKKAALRAMNGINNFMIVAVKMLRDTATLEEKNEFLLEIEFMKNVGFHKNIICMLACCTEDKDTVLLVVEYADKGDLLTFLRDKRKKMSTGKSLYATKDEIEDGATIRDGKDKTISIDNLLNDFMSFSWQIAKGMEYLTSKGIVHRDLAARNILLANDNLVKIADFGLSRHVTYKEQIYQSQGRRKLPIKWMSPEAIFEQTFTTKSDIWSYGVVLWEIYSMGGAPYPTITNAALLHYLRKGNRLEKPELCSEEMYQLMTKCWVEHAQDRPSFNDVILDLETLMTRDNPYVEFMGIDENNECYMVPSFKSAPDSEESGDELTMM